MIKPRDRGEMSNVTSLSVPMVLTEAGDDESGRTFVRVMYGADGPDSVLYLPNRSDVALLARLLYRKVMVTIEGDADQ
jgi:hypothetical protein